MSMVDSVRARLASRDEAAAYRERDTIAREQKLFTQGAKVGEERTLAQLSPQLEALVDENLYMKNVLAQPTHVAQGLYSSSVV